MSASSPDAHPRPPLVRLARVDKRYGAGPLILSAVDLEVRHGDFIALIGPSGCGKSTLLRVVAGLNPITGGEIVVDGMTPENAREEMAFVFQEPTLLPWLTVEENIRLVLELRGDRAARRVEEVERVLALVRLGERRHYYPRQLSGGQKMRVSIARALALSPRLLLLDEPFGALDEMTRDHLNEELLALRTRHNWTALFVTHSVSEAVFLASRIIVLAPTPGRVAAEVPVPFAYPRTAALRAEPDFHALTVEVSRLLRAVRPAAAPTEAAA